MDGFERRKNQTKENIRKAAGELFGKFGVSRVSIADIARKAGVSQVTIYNHFGSKENLVQDWISTIRGEFIGRLQSVSHEERPFPEKLKGVFQCMIDVLQDRHLEISDLEIQNEPEIRPLLESVWTEMVHLFLELIKEGKSQGYLAPELSDEAVVAYFNLLLQGIYASPELHVRLHNSPELSHDLVSLMVYGFGQSLLTTDH